MVGEAPVDARTPHGFALAPGMIASEYVEAADRRSTLAMLALFAEVWPVSLEVPAPSDPFTSARE